MKSAFTKLSSLFASDVSYKDFDKLMKRDLPELYDFYRRRMKRNPAYNFSKPGKFTFLKNLFLEFLGQVTPIRRFFYLISLVVFIIGIIGNLGLYTVIAFMIVNILFALELTEKILAKNELEVAREIQTSLLPESFPANEHFEICGFSEPALEVGGDYFDFISHNGNQHTQYIVIGDISGKGLGAALHMIQVRTMLSYLTSGGLSPSEILTELNEKAGKIFAKGIFLTMCLLKPDRNGKIQFSRAGHMPLIIYRAKSDRIETSTPRGMGIGLTSDSTFRENLEQKTVETCKGDILILYTDGVIEAKDQSNTEFGESRLQNLVKQNSKRSAGEILELIRQQLISFSGDTPRHDDTTVIVIKAI